MRVSSLRYILPVLALGLALAACAPSHVGVHAAYHQRPHYVAVSPGVDYVWSDGYWYHGHHHSRWIPGYWTRHHHHGHSWGWAPSYRSHRHRSHHRVVVPEQTVQPRERRVYSGYYH